MRKRWLISALLVVVVGAGIVIISARLRGLRIAPPLYAPELLSLIPANANILLYADLGALRSSTFMMRLAELMPPVKRDREYAEFVSATGFDYERDLDRFVLAISNDEKNSVNAAGKNQVTTAIADGRFDENKIAAYALRYGKAEKQNGNSIYIVPVKTPANRGNFGNVVALRFLSGSRIMLTSALFPGPKPATVRELEPRTTASETASGRIIDNFAPKRLAPEIQERITRVSGAPVFAFVKVDRAMQGRTVMLGNLRSDQLENLARSVLWLTAAARPQSDRVDVVLEAECESTENARQLAGALDGLRIVGQMALADPKTRRQMDPATLPLLEALLRGAEVSRYDKGGAHRVRVTFILSEKMLRAPPATR